MAKKRGVMKVWMAILSTIGGLVGIAGVTVLGMFLAGNFTEEKIEPENMAFTQEVVSGLGSYDENLGMYLVASDFSITISTTTEEVTATKVTLSLDGGITSGGYVSNGVITVPEIVTLGEAFSVTLDTDTYGTVNGGIATITARSENTDLTYISTTVAVDVPVQELGVSVLEVEATSDEGALEVVEGTEFALDVSFSPTLGQYKYSIEGEEKTLFYSLISGSSYISYDYTTGKFTALEKSGTSSASVTVYSFVNSYYEEQFFAMYPNVDDMEDLTDYAIRYFSSNSDKCVTKTVQIKVVDVTISEVSVGTTSIAVTADKTFTLTTSSTSNGDASLGLSIKDSEGTSRNEVFGSVGILYTSAVAQTISISGGKIMKVAYSQVGEDVVVTSISQISALPSTWQTDDALYYILPNTSASAYSNYSWTIRTDSDLDLTSAVEAVELKINFFYQEDDGSFATYFDIDSFTSQVKAEQNSLSANETNSQPTVTVSVSAVTASSEEAPSWTDYSTLSLKITYDEEGEIVAPDVDLSTILSSGSNFSSNVYKTVKYFVFNANTQSTTVITDVFDCLSPAQKYTQNFLGSTISLTIGGATYNSITLYELSSTTLTALTSTSSDDQFYVIAATVRTDASGKIWENSLWNYEISEGEVGGARYQIINFSSAKLVEVTSALSITNMSAEIVLNTADSEGDYPTYIPYVTYDSDGNVQTAITITISLIQKTDNDKDILLQEYSEGALTLLCYRDSISQDHLSTDMSLSGLAYTNSTEVYGNTILTFTGTVSISATEFENQRPYAGWIYQLQISYDDDKNTRTKDVTLNLGGSSSDQKTFVVYYPRPYSISYGYSSIAEETLEISVKSGENGTTYTWGTQTTTGTSSEVVSAINEFLKFSFTDQFGNEISSLLYDVKLVEDTSGNSTSYIQVDENTGNTISYFSSTAGSTVYPSLIPYVIDKKNDDAKITNSYSNTILDDSYDSSAYLQAPTISLKITSDGVYKIVYDNTTAVSSSSTSTANTELTGSSLTNVVTVEKYVTTNDELTLANLIDVYTGSETSSTKSTLTFTLSSSHASMSEATQKELGAMLSFFDSEGDPYSVAEAVSGHSASASPVQISKIKFNAPFGTDTTLSFVVSDSNKMFEIQLNIVCKAVGSISSYFSTYATSTSSIYSSYLPSAPSTSPSASVVFADNAYALDDFLKLGINQNTTVSLSWTSTTAVLSDTSTSVELKSVGGDLSISIGQLLSAQEIIFTLYYGVASSYAIQTSVTLYAVPNILIEEVVSAVGSNVYFNLSSASSNTFTTDFVLYKATEYIDQKASATQGEITTYSFETLGLSFASLEDEDDQYLTISSYEYSLASKNLSLDLGGSISQSFAIVVSKDGDTYYYLDAVRVQKAGESGSYTYSSPILFGSTGAMLSVDIGFGDEEATIAAIFGASSNVGFTTYDGSVVLVLLSGASYSLGGTLGFKANAGIGAFANASASGYLSVGQTGKIISYPESNTTTLECTISNLTVTVKISAIVSLSGDVFVYYSNADDVESGTSTTLAFNTYYVDGSAAEFTTLVGSASSLENNDIYQEVVAGSTYKIVHVYEITDGVSTLESQVTTSEIADYYGFYLKSTTGLSYTLSVQSVIGTTSANKTVDLSSLVTIEDDLQSISIAHLESTQYTTVYALLALEMKTTQDTFTYYYRIKINPSFTASDVVYPYATGAEYLDTDAGSYQTVSTTDSDGEAVVFNAYVIDFDETFTAANSNAAENTEKLGVTRFPSVTFINGANEADYSITYSIYSITTSTGDVVLSSATSFATYVDTDYSGFEGSVLTLKLLDNDVASVQILGQYTIGSSSAFGGDLYYTLSFDTTNTTYSTTLLDSASAALEPSGNTYSISLKAGSDESTYTLSVSKVVGSISSSATVYAYVKDLSTLASKGITTSEAVAASQNEDFDALSDISFTQSTGKLAITPAANVSTDRQLEIGFYSNMKLVCKIILTITGYYDYAINGTEADSTFNFVGGKTYNYYEIYNTSPIGVFSTLASTNAEVTISTVSLSLENGDSTATVGQNTIALSSLVNITDNNSTWADGTLSFADLTEDVTFTFKCVINEGGDSQYSFTFSITVGANANTNGVSYTRDTSVYGGESASTDLSEAYSTSSSSNSDIIYRIQSGDTYSDTIEFYGQVVAKETTVTIEFTIAALFKNENGEIEVGGENYVLLYTKTLTYKYNALPNISLSTTYPTPDGTTALTADDGGEYLGTTQNTNEEYVTEAISLTDTAYFATAARIISENLGSKTNVAWVVSIDSAENATVTATGGGSTVTDATSGTIFTSGSIAADNQITGGDLSTLSLTFKLTSSASSGKVVLVISANNVEISFTFTIVAGSVISLAQNTPTETDYVDYETIYAEDLSTQDQTIFTQNRLLSFTLLQQGTYYVNLSNGTQSKSFEITGAAGEEVILDLGESLNGYSYEGTYTAVDANGNVSGSALDDEEIFSAIPTLTARVVATYADGTIISLSDWGNLYYNLTYQDGTAVASGVELETFSLTGSHTDTQLVFEIYFELAGTSESLDMNEGNYSVLLTTDLVVSKNADADGSYSVHDISVVNSSSSAIYLLDDDSASTSLASTIGITNVAGEYYSTSLVKSNNAQILLTEYGFSDLKVVSSSSIEASSNTQIAALQNTAYKINNYLVSTQQSGGFYYHTGLTPRAGGFVMNNAASSSGTAALDYIALIGNTTGTTSSGSGNTNYRLYAQGANNDGNHVMMLLTYSVTLGDGSTASSYHNILFRVVTSTSVSYKTSNSSTAVNASVSAIDTTKGEAKRQTIATNSTPYTITVTSLSSNDTYDFYLNSTTSSTDIDDSSVIQIKTNSTDVSSSFTYTQRGEYKYGATTYNSWKSSTQKYDSSSGAWEIDGTAISSETNSAITTSDSIKKVSISQSITLGEQYFMIDFENEFGYRGRFYFKIVSANNPTVSTVNTYTITEGDDIAFGTNSTLVSAATDSEGYFQYESFTYEAIEDTDNQETYYPDIILAYATTDGSNSKNTYIDSIKISVKLGSGASYFGYTKYIQNGETEKTTLSSGDVLTTEIENISNYLASISLMLQEWSFTYTYQTTTGGTTTTDTDTQKFDYSSLASGVTWGDALAGSTVTVYVKVVEAATSEGLSVLDELNVYAIAYFDANIPIEEILASEFNQQLSITYSTSSSTVIKPYFQTYAAYYADMQVTLSGIASYAFATSDLVIDLESATGVNDSSVSSYASSTSSEDLYITAVDFYLGEVYLGSGTWNGDGTTAKAALITNEDYTYIRKNDSDEYELYQGEISLEGNMFTAPNIDGIYYGTGNTLSGVTMSVSISDGNETAKINITVTLQRNTYNAFSDSALNIKDGAQPTAPAPSDFTLLNDTLEVTLQPGETVSLAVSDTEISDELEVTYYDRVGSSEEFDSTQTYYKYEISSSGNGATYKKYGESGLAALTASTFDPSLNTYYVEHVSYGLVASDAEYDATQKYYTINSETGAYEEVTNLTEETFTPGSTAYYIKQATTRNVIELTNNYSYAITEYVGISANVVDSSASSTLTNNFANGQNFYIVANSTDSDGEKTTPIIYYNGSQITFSSDYITVSGDDENTLYYIGKIGGSPPTIGQYTTSGDNPASTDALTIEIPHVDALTSGGYMSQALYFIIQQEGSSYQSYQKQQVFKVYPKYDAAELSDSTSTTITVDSYFAIQSEDQTSEYYVIPLSVWAENIVATNSVVSSTVKGDLFDATNYTFKIEGTGSAFIDENGTITTVENFQISTNLIIVQVYMKVSGQDGNFEDDNTELLIGTFDIYLDESSVKVGDPLISANGGEGTYYFKTTYSGESSYNVIVVPEGYSLYNVCRTNITYTVYNDFNLDSESVLYTSYYVSGTGTTYEEVKNIESGYYTDYVIASTGNLDAYYDISIYDNSDGTYSKTADDNLVSSKYFVGTGVSSYATATPEIIKESGATVYELTTTGYKETSDTEFVESKVYYLKVPTTSNDGYASPTPVDLGLFEASDTYGFVLSTDTAFDSSKTYYYMQCYYVDSSDNLGGLYYYSSGNYVAFATGATGSNGDCVYEFSVATPTSLGLYIYTTTGVYVEAEKYYVAHGDIVVDENDMKLVSEPETTNWPAIFSLELGQTIDFSEIFGETFASWTNVAYHVVSYEINSTKTYLVRNNNDTFTPSSSGVYTVCLLVAGYEDDGYTIWGYYEDEKYKEVLIKVTLMVYDLSSSATKTSKSFVLENGEEYLLDFSDVSAVYELNEDGTLVNVGTTDDGKLYAKMYSEVSVSESEFVASEYYVVNNNRYMLASTLASSSYDATQTYYLPSIFEDGTYSKTYLVLDDDNNISVVNATIYVHSTEQHSSAVVAVGSEYKLANLIEDYNTASYTYTFYEIASSYLSTSGTATEIEGDLSTITTQSTSGKGAGSNETICYLLLITDRTSGDVEGRIVYTTYKIVSSTNSTSTNSVYIKNTDDTITAADIQSAIVEVLGLSEYEFANPITNANSTYVTFVLSNASSVENGRTYYYVSSEAGAETTTYAVANPITLGLYVKKSGKYSASTDTKFVGGTTYYIQSTADGKTTYTAFSPATYGALYIAQFDEYAYASKNSDSSYMIIQVIGANGNVLSLYDAISLGSANISSNNKYLVTYKTSSGEAEKTVILTMNFYAYTAASETEEAYTLVSYQAESISFALSGLNSEVLSTLGETSATISYYQLSGTTLSQVTSVSLTESRASEQFYVRVETSGSSATTTYYLFNITINMYSTNTIGVYADDESGSYALSNLNASTLNLSSALSFAYFEEDENGSYDKQGNYVESGGTLKSITDISDISNYTSSNPYKIWIVATNSTSGAKYFYQVSLYYVGAKVSADVTVELETQDGYITLSDYDYDLVSALASKVTLLSSQGISSYTVVWYSSSSFTSSTKVQKAQVTESGVTVYAKVSVQTPSSTYVYYVTANLSPSASE